MNLSAAMFMRKRNAVIVLQDFIAAADVRLMHITLPEISVEHMTSAVNFRRNALNVQLCLRQQRVNPSFDDKITRVKKMEE